MMIYLIQKPACKIDSFSSLWWTWLWWTWTWSSVWPNRPKFI